MKRAPPIVAPPSKSPGAVPIYRGEKPAELVRAGVLRGGKPTAAAKSAKKTM